MICTETEPSINIEVVQTSPVNLSVVENHLNQVVVLETTSELTVEESGDITLTVIETGENTIEVPPPVVPEIDIIFPVVVGIKGDKGDQGDIGPEGPQGPQRVPGASTGGYLHTQVSPSSTWIVNHNLGLRPLVSVYSVGGMEVTADIIHISINQLTISFSNPFAGYARAN